jgi:hypothetical protein
MPEEFEELSPSEFLEETHFGSWKLILEESE